MASKRSECQLSNWSVSVTSQNNDFGSFHAPPQRISNFNSSNGLGFRMRLTHYNNGLYLYHHIYGHIPLGDMVSSCSPLHGGVCMQLLSICLSIYLYTYWHIFYIHTCYIYIYTYPFYLFFLLDGKESWQQPSLQISFALMPTQCLVSCTWASMHSHSSSLPSKSVLHRFCTHAYTMPYELHMSQHAQSQQQPSLQISFAFMHTQCRVSCTRAGLQGHSNSLGS